MPFGRLVLASASARRRQLLQQLSIPFEVYPCSIEEPLPEEGEDPADFVARAALFKGQGVRVAINDPDAWILSADTIVVLDGIALGKPKSPEQACEMLNMLSGRMHSVFTGFSILRDNGEIEYQQTVETRVWFRFLREDRIQAYVNTGEPMDKAGSYGIQEKGAVFVDRIEGDYYNVVGLPIGDVVDALERLGAGQVFLPE
jgi:septum formation protein